VGKLFSRVRHLAALVFLALGNQFYCAYAAWWERYDLDALAVIRVPVADMLSKPARLSVHPSDVLSFYRQLPLSCDSKSARCARIHQCLLNEVLFETAYDFQTLECSGQLPDAYYGVNKKTQKPLTSFYTLASNTISLKDLMRSGINLDSIPPPLFARDCSSPTSLTLLLPWCDQLSKITYSAGTRFVRLPEYDDADSYAVRIIDYIGLLNTIRRVPKTYCLTERSRSSGLKRALFVKILKLWVGQAMGVIPYVLGGSSFVHLYDKAIPFWLEEDATHNKIWMRADQVNPQTGFDCSELVWRAARMAGISYYYKNTATLARYLKPLDDHNDLQEGDLMWVPGHVMVISDIANNMFIESAGYIRGYGKVHGISLKQKFKNIATYADLVRAYSSKRGVTLYSYRGEPTSYEEFKIFKLLRD